MKAMPYLQLDQFKHNPKIERWLPPQVASGLVSRTFRECINGSRVIGNLLRMIG